MRGVVCLLALLATICASCGADRQPPQREVPNVAGINAAAAECKIAGAGLTWRYVGQSGHPNVIGACSGRYPAAENVCTQSPRAGSRMPAGSVVTLKLWAPGLNKRTDCDQPPAINRDPRGHIQDIASVFFRQAKIHNASASCRLLTTSEHARLDQGDGGCEAVIDRDLSPRIRHGRETVPIVLSYDGQRGKARVRLLPGSSNGTAPVIALVRRGQRWFIADSGIGSVS